MVWIALLCQLGAISGFVMTRVVTLNNLNLRESAQSLALHGTEPSSRQGTPCMVASPVELYDSMLHTHPLLTKCLTSSALFGVSDAIAQAGEIQQSTAVQVTPSGDTAMPPPQVQCFNLRRVGRFMVTGIGSGICWHHWFGFEQSFVADVTSGMEGSALVVARSVLGISLEQFVMIPFYFSLYLVPVISVQNGLPLSAIPGEIKDKLPGLFVSNAKVWTPANAIIYNLPEEWRCLGSNTVDVLWGIICSTMVNRDACAVEDDDECVLEDEGGYADTPLELACDADVCLVAEPSIIRGRGMPRLLRRRVRRSMAGMGHAIFALQKTSTGDGSGGGGDDLTTGARATPQPQPVRID